MIKRFSFLALMVILAMMFYTGMAIADTVSQTVTVTVNVPPYLEVSTSNLAPSKNQEMIMGGIPPIMINAIPGIESSGTTEFAIIANTPGSIEISYIVQPIGKIIKPISPHF